MDESTVSNGKLPFSLAKVDLKQGDILKFKKFKVGSRIRLVIEGEIKAKSEEKVDNEANTAETGSLELNVKNMSVSGSNEFTDLFQEEMS